MSCEGTGPILTEGAMLSPTTGNARMLALMAVAKRADFYYRNQRCLNRWFVGEPAVDLAIAMSIVSGLQGVDCLTSIGGDEICVK